MRTTNIRELKHATSTVLGWVEEGETVEITRRNKVVAVLSPPEPPERTSVRRPDFAARLKETWGDRVLVPSWADVVSEERGDR